MTDRSVIFDSVWSPQWDREATPEPLCISRSNHHFAIAVWVEAASGKVLARFDATDLNVHQRISEMADPLHFGTFGGYWTKAIWVLFGGLLTALSVSGMAIYALRIGREIKQATPLRVGWQRVWQGMGHWRWIATACVLVGLAMVPTLFWASAE